MWANDEIEVHAFMGIQTDNGCFSFDKKISKNP